MVSSQESGVRSQEAGDRNGRLKAGALRVWKRDVGTVRQWTVVSKEWIGPDSFGHAGEGCIRISRDIMSQLPNPQ